MAKYTIEDTTLTALGDAVRTLVNKKGLYESEEPITNSFNMTDFYTIITSIPDVYEPIVEVVRFPGAKNVRVEFNYSSQNGQWGFWIAPGEHTEEPEGAYRYVGMWLPSESYNVNKEIIFEDTDVISFGTYAWSYHDPDGQHMANYLGYYIQSYGQFKYTFTPANMAEEIEAAAASTSIIPESALTITGVATYKFSYGGWDWFINQMGDKITTQNITNTNYMFAWSQVVAIPFTINMDENIASYVTHDLSYMFNGATRLVEAPMIYGVKSASFGSLFSDCQSLTTIPEGFAEDWNWEYVDNLTSAYTGSMASMFYHCYNLRTIPQILLSHGNPYWSYSYPLIKSGFNGCHSLEKIENVFIPYKGSYTSSYANAFSDSVKECYRLKKLTLATQEDGTPYTVSWGYQVIDLTANVGWSTTNYTGLDKRTDFTTDTLIDSEEKWRGYIDGSYPDGWANDVAYSTFGATAAKELFASLPIASGTGNTVKLNANATSAISGEAMSSLTEEDIAVATAKGWTITLL